MRRKVSSSVPLVGKKMRRKKHKIDMQIQTGSKILLVILQSGFTVIVEDAVGRIKVFYF